MIFSLRLLRRNLGYKLISIGVAILLYVVAYLQQNPRRSTNVYVQPQPRGLSADMALRQPVGGYMVSLTGVPTAVEALRSQGLKAFVNLEAARPGTSKLPVEYEVPEGLRPHVEVEGPVVVDVVLERKRRKPFPIEVQYVSRPPAGYTFKEPETRPDRVHVAGLESDVNRVASVVASLDTQGAAGAITDVVDVVARDVNQEVVEKVELQPSRVRVELGLKEVPATQNLLLSPVFVGEPARGFRIDDYSFRPRAVTVAGSRERLAALTSLDVPVTVEGLSEDLEREVVPRIPPGLRLLRRERVFVIIRVQPNRAAPAPPPPPGEPAPPPAAETPQEGATP